MIPERIGKKELESSFMLGHWLDGLGIVSYLQSEDLVQESYLIEDKPCEGVGKYILTGGGSIEIVANHHHDLTQIRISKGVSKDISDALRELGEESRERFRLSER